MATPAKKGMAGKATPAPAKTETKAKSEKKNKETHSQEEYLKRGNAGLMALMIKGAIVLAKGAKSALLKDFKESYINSGLKNRLAGYTKGLIFKLDDKGDTYKNLLAAAKAAHAAGPEKWTPAMEKFLKLAIELEGTRGGGGGKGFGFSKIAAAKFQ